MTQTLIVPAPDTQKRSRGSKIFLGKYRVSAEEMTRVEDSSERQLRYEGEEIDSGKKVMVEAVPAAFLRRQERERLEAHAIGAKNLNDVNIHPLHDFGVHDDHFIYVTEDIEGTVAEEWVKTHGPMPLGLVLRIASQAVSALGAAGAQRVVHRAIIPSNLLLLPGETAKGEWPLVKLLHFEGVTSKPAGASETASSEKSLPYTSPEQLRYGVVDSRSEIYSLGATLWFLLTGAPPPMGPEGLMAAQPATAGPAAKALPIPEKLRRFLATTLSADPTTRPRDPLAFYLQLQECMTEAGPPVPTESRALSPPPDSPAPMVAARALSPPPDSPAQMVAARALSPSPDSPAPTVAARALSPSPDSPAQTVAARALSPSPDSPAQTVAARALGPSPDSPAPTVAARALSPPPDSPAQTVAARAFSPSPDSPVQMVAAPADRRIPIRVVAFIASLLVIGLVAALVLPGYLRHREPSQKASSTKARIRATNVAASSPPASAGGPVVIVGQTISPTPSQTAAPALNVSLLGFTPMTGTPGEKDFKVATLSFRIEASSPVAVTEGSFYVDSITFHDGSAYQPPITLFIHAGVFLGPSGTKVDPAHPIERTIWLKSQENLFPNWQLADDQTENATFRWRIAGQPAGGSVVRSLHKPWSSPRPTPEVRRAVQEER